MEFRQREILASGLFSSMVFGTARAPAAAAGSGFMSQTARHMKAPSAIASTRSAKRQPSVFTRICTSAWARTDSCQPALSSPRLNPQPTLSTPNSCCLGGTNTWAAFSAGQLWLPVLLFANRSAAHICSGSPDRAPICPLVPHPRPRRRGPAQAPCSLCRQTCVGITRVHQVVGARCAPKGV